MIPHRANFRAVRGSHVLLSCALWLTDLAGCGAHPVCRLSLRSASIEIHLSSEGISEVLLPADGPTSSTQVPTKYVLACNPDQVSYVCAVADGLPPPPMSGRDRRFFAPTDEASLQTWRNGRHASTIRFALRVEEQHPVWRGLVQEIKDTAGYSLALALRERAQAEVWCDEGDMVRACVAYQYALRHIVRYRTWLAEMSPIPIIEESEFALTKPLEFHQGGRHADAVAAYRDAWHDLAGFVTQSREEDAVRVTVDDSYWTASDWEQDE